MHYVAGHSSIDFEKSKPEYQAELQDLINSGIVSRNNFGDIHIWFKREILRIGVRDIFHHISLGSVVREISNLADVILDEVFRYVFDDVGGKMLTTL